MGEKRYTVLIADDEPKIRRGLRQQLIQMPLPLTVCGEAEDGEMALSMVENLRPDILLLDINMPFLNGLEFLRAIRRTRLDVRVIIITGYEEVEYLRSAISLDVQAFLFKPIDLKELERSLGEAMEKLEEMRQRNRHFEWAIAQIVDRRDALREEFLRDAIAGRLEEDEIRDFSVYFDLPTQGRRMLMAVSAHYPGAQEKPWENKRRLFALQDILPRQLPDLPLICLFSDDYRNILLLYDAPEGQDARVEEALRKLLRQEPGLMVRTALCALPRLTDLENCHALLLEQLREGAAPQPVVIAARKLIQERYAQVDLSLTDVAADLGINPSYLSRLMKQETGMSFSKYLSGVRIAEAIRLMRDPTVRIWQVAERVGYSAASYFSAAFKKVLGVSPADYRREEGEE